MRYYNGHRSSYRGCTVLLACGWRSDEIYLLKYGRSGDVQSQPLPENMEVSQGLKKGQYFTHRSIYYALQKIPSLCQPLLKWYESLTNIVTHRL